VLPTRKPRRLVGPNVVAEFLAAGGARKAMERLLRSEPVSSVKPA
jgi:hypothetical protein